MRATIQLNQLIPSVLSDLASSISKALVWEQGTHALVEAGMVVAHNNGVTLNNDMDRFKPIQISVVEYVL